MSTKRIVVGYDGSPESEQAVQWALGEAARSPATVELVHVWAWPAYMPAASMIPGTAVWPGAEAEQASRDMLAGAVAAARTTRPDVQVTSAFAHGATAMVLLNRAEHADLLVGGGRSHGALAEVLLGSIASAVATHALCPVVVVRNAGRTDDRRAVAVGLDDSPEAELTAAFAFEQAADLGVPLHAVRAWMPPPDPWIGSRFVDRDAITAAQQAFLEDLLAGWREKFPSVPVSSTVAVGYLSPARREDSP